MNFHNSYFKHAALINGRKCVFCYSNNYAYKLDDRLQLIEQQCVDFPFESHLANSFPLVRLKSGKIVGIPMNSRQLYEVEEFNVIKICEAPPVY